MLKFIALGFKLGKGLSVALSYSLYVKIEAQRQVKSVLYWKVSAKKESFIFVNFKLLTSVGSCKNMHQIFSNVLCGS